MLVMKGPAELLSQLAGLMGAVDVGHNHAADCQDPELDADWLIAPWRNGQFDAAHKINTLAVLTAGDWADALLLHLASTCALTPKALDSLLASPGVGDYRQIGPYIKIIRSAHDAVAERRGFPEYMAAQFGASLNSVLESRNIRRVAALQTITHLAAIEQCLYAAAPLPGCGAGDHHELSPQCALARAAVALVKATNDPPETEPREAADEAQPQPAEHLPTTPFTNPATADEGSADPVAAGA